MDHKPTSAPLGTNLAFVIILCWVSLSSSKAGTIQVWAAAAIAIFCQRPYFRAPVSSNAPPNREVVVLAIRRNRAASSHSETTRAHALILAATPHGCRSLSLNDVVPSSSDCVLDTPVALPSHRWL